MRNFLTGLTKGQQKELVDLLKRTPSEQRQAASAIESHLNGDSASYNQLISTDRPVVATDEEVEAICKYMRI